MITVAKQRSKKSNYKSRYGGEYISAAQYLTELICEKRGEYEGNDLPAQFWRMDKWSRFFREQVGAANDLLSRYSDKAIIAAVGKLKRLYSLRNPLVEQYCKEEQAKLNVLDKMERTVIPELNEGATHKPFVKAGKLGKLRDLEGNG